MEKGRELPVGLAVSTVDSVATLRNSKFNIEHHSNILTGRPGMTDMVKMCIALTKE